MIGHDAGRDTAQNWRDFAEREARGKSPLYEELAAGVSGDSEVLALVEALPTAKRQPNLVLGAARFVTGTPDGYGDFRARLLRAWPEIRAVALARRTQTNEVGRCATLLPLLARLPQPLALLEVGASAGLCLNLDRYRYRYGTTELGPPDSPVTLTCEVEGDVPIPAALPRIAWRAGLDVSPLHAGDPDAARWLETLVWPGQEERRERLSAALAIARGAPVRVVAGDLAHDIGALAAQAPADATLVVFHSAVLAYVAGAARDRFAAEVTASRATWIANEGEHVLARRGSRGVDGAGRPRFLVSQDGEPVAWADPHGAWLGWIG